METRNRIGGAWLAEGVAIDTFVEIMRPAPNLRGHLTFQLKHEVDVDQGGEQGDTAATRAASGGKGARNHGEWLHSENAGAV